MLSISADDQRAVSIAAAIRRGDVETLQRKLRESPTLAAARVVDDRPRWPPQIPPPVAGSNSPT